MDPFVKKEAPTDEKSRRMAKTKHKLGTNSACGLRTRGRKGGTRYDGGVLKAAVGMSRSSTQVRTETAADFDELLTLGKSLGSGREGLPVQDMVPVSQSCVAQIKQPQNSRIDRGFALATSKENCRTDDRHGWLAKKDRITHRLEITLRKQIDGEAKKWLKTAYDLDRGLF